jgi:acyl-coenzyme A synthetase/AMP-(fatty) acid ligase
VLFIVPPVAVMLTKRPDLLRQYDLSCVMALFCSAAPLPPEVEKELATMLPGLVFLRARQS